MRNYILIFVVSSLFSACKKENESGISDAVKTYSGYLYKDCKEEEAFAGLELNFYDHKFGGIGVSEKNDFRGTVVTDSNGFYSITAEFKWNTIIVKDHNSREVFKMYNELNTVDRRVNSTRTWYNQPVSYHPVKILTNKSYSNQDTIYLGAKGGSYIDTLFTGPYLNNQVFENIILHTPFLSNGYVSATSDSEIGSNIWWGFGKAQYDSLTNNGVGWEDHIIKNVKQRMCKAGDTIVVDLRVLD